MATGDAAAAAGMALVSGSENANTLDTEDNKTRDYIVQWAAWSKISGKPSTFAPSTHTHDWASVTGKPSTFTPASHNHDAANITTGTLSSSRIPNLDASKITAGTITRSVSTSGSGRFGAAWDNNITSTRRAVWMEEDGTLGHTASSARYKKSIARWDGMDDDEKFAALQVVTFQWRAAHADPAAPDAVEVGMIAEHLHDLGLTFAVFYGPDAFGVLRPEGIHYDRLVLLVIPHLQRIAARVASLETRLATLEGAAA